jgi:hypothetical protein
VLERAETSLWSDFAIAGSPARPVGLDAWPPRREAAVEIMESQFDGMACDAQSGDSQKKSKQARECGTKRLAESFNKVASKCDPID